MPDRVLQVSAMSLFRFAYSPTDEALRVHFTPSLVAAELKGIRGVGSAIAVVRAFPDEETSILKHVLSAGSSVKASLINGFMQSRRAFVQSSSYACPTSLT
jgi:hypothetical protein